MKKLKFEIQYSFGNPQYLNVFENGKKICRFWYNMTGWLQDFSLKNAEGIPIEFGERSQSQQQAAFKKALKDGFTNIQNFQK